MKWVLRLVLCSLAASMAASRGAVVRVNAADDLWQRVRTTYGDLRSYADTGEIAIEYGVSSTDRHTFSTAFVRAPRHFLLDFRKQGGDRYVIWADADAFHTWWKTTGQQSDYANPNNAPAISQSGRNTASAALKIPTLLYSKATLGGDFVNFTDATSDGSDTVAGHRCYRLLGTTRDVYAATGKEVNVRKLTLWIDAESLLIRKVLEEAKPLPGQRNRIVTTYEPRANVAVAESTFRFVPPGI
jgi:Predicted periplasmic protein (DUF2092)